ncbi:hypothetical protein [Bifidobacterium pseudolongum]|uniref:Uncharacterized protein n=1 Tax=Bifidobacterium pseudolongum subsp. globosum TaxID=1690 RepID=A0A4Q5AWE1_9BIFI|nr:hypothetical protein [Bifidobacterium pseudolongum]RYQ38709.1 hypothetical protein PG2003B_0072 [Bifidobacterium pseudolongum subsp. globosum]
MDTKRPLSDYTRPELEERIRKLNAEARGYRLKAADWKRQAQFWETYAKRLENNDGARGTA